jgi:HEAT repeats
LFSTCWKLTDADVRVRMESCEGLRWLKRPEAIAPLRSALGNEQEDIVRQRMQSTLDFSLSRARRFFIEGEDWS